MTAPIISRENLVLSIIGSLREASLVLVEGDPGVGVSTVLEQLGELLTRRVTVNIRTSHRTLYHPRLILFSLVEQLCTIFGRPFSNNDTDRVEDIYRSLLAKLDRLNTHGESVHFVIDGLHQIPHADLHIRDEIAQQLPLGFPGCRFIVAGSREHLPTSIFHALEPVSHRVPGLTPDETKTFLAGTLLSNETLTQLRHASGCNPSVLASVRRLLESGTHPDEVMKHVSSSPPKLFRIEWEKASPSALLTQALAIVTHDETEHTIATLAGMLSADEHKLREELNSLRFIRLTDDKVSYISQLFKNFAEQRLQQQRSAALDLAISFHLKTPDGANSVSVLPRFLGEQRRYSDLLGYLSPSRFLSSVRVLGTAHGVHNCAVSGLEAARKIRRYDDLVRFAVHGATLANLHATQPCASEARALLRLGKHDEALALAESATVAEDRLQLLAIVGRDLAENGIRLQDRHLKLIEDLCSTVDTQLFSERGVDLAENLFFIRPELGLRLFEVASRHIRNDDRAAWSYADLTVEASRLSKQATVPPDALSLLKSRISNPEARLSAACEAAVYSKATGNEIWSEAAQLSCAADTIRLASTWVNTNPTHADALVVVERAIELLERSSEEVPDARSLRRLARALATAPHNVVLPPIVAKFDALAEVAKRNGPSEEMVRLQCYLARAEWNYNRVDCTKRATETIFFALDLEDPATQAACLAALKQSLQEIDEDKTLDISDSLHGDVDRELRTAITATLDSAADPDVALAPALTAIATADLDMALETVDRYTSKVRRDTGLIQILSALILADKKHAKHVPRVLSMLADEQVRQHCRHISLSALASLGEIDKDSAVDFITSLDESWGVGSLAVAVQVLRQCGAPDDLIAKASKLLQVSWGNLDSDWRKIDTGFATASQLAPDSPELAQKFLDETRQLKSDVILDSQLRAHTYELCARLAVLAFGALLGEHRETQQNTSDIADILGAVQGRSERLALWVDLALRYDMAGRTDDCRKLRDRQILPMVEDARSRSISEYANSLVDAAPVLFVCNSTMTLEQLRDLRQPQRDQALFRTARYVLTRLTPKDPWTTPIDGAYDCSYERLLQVLHLAELLESDSLTYGLVRDVSLTARSRKKLLTREQKRFVGQRITEIAHRKFPTPGFVRHQGYLFVCQAQAMTLVQTPLSAWMQLLQDSRTISHDSDLVFILLTVGACVPPVIDGKSTEPERKALLIEIRDRIDRLKYTADRYLRLVDLADEYANSDKGAAREALRAAAALGKSLSTSSSRRRRAIDLAHRIDPEFARTLAATMDDDPAREDSRVKLTEDFKIRELAAALRSGGLSEHSHENVSAAAWLELENVNVGRSVALPSDEIWELIQRSATMPLHLAYPLLGLSFVSAARHFAGSEQSVTILRSILEGSLTAARVARELSQHQRVNEQRRDEPVGGSSEPTLKSISVGIGERQLGLNWLERWCAEAVVDFLIICDPYFQIDDLEALRIVAETAPSVRVRVLTSRYALRNVPHPQEIEFRSHWRAHVSSSDPPPTEVMAAGIGARGDALIHDRWWLTRGRGIKLGTSFNGIGRKLSAISEMPFSEYSDAFDEVGGYLERRKIQSLGERIDYGMFSL